MVIVAGLERMTFEVLRVLKARGAEVHCILNEWENHRIRPLAEAIGSTWTTGAYRCPMRRHQTNMFYWTRFAWDVARTSFGLLRDGYRFRPTHVLLPEFAAALRNAPALLVMRAIGVRVVLRMANHPDEGPFYKLIWRRVLPALVATFVANSEFAYRRALTAGVPRDRLVLIKNAVSHRAAESREDALRASLRSRRTLLCVGQIAPYKGTDLAIEATILLLEKGANLQLVVVGAEPEWPAERVEYFQKLIARVADAGFDSDIVFAGPRDDVLQLMSLGFLLLAPIRQEETFGNVVLEAKSVGLPVVAFPRGGITEVVEHFRTGYLCSTLDARGLVAGVEHFLADESAWRRAKELCLASFDDPACEYRHDVFARNWMKLFEER